MGTADGPSGFQGFSGLRPRRRRPILKWVSKYPTDECIADKSAPCNTSAGPPRVGRQILLCDKSARPPEGRGASQPIRSHINEETRQVRRKRPYLSRGRGLGCFRKGKQNQAESRVHSQVV